MINKINTFLYSKFTFLFFSLMLYILAAPYLSNDLSMRLVFLFITMLIFVAVVFAIPQKPKQLIFFISLVMIVFVLNCLEAFFSNHLFSILNSASFIVFCIVSICFFLKEIMRHSVITRDLVIGAVCIYLLIGLGYANIYSLLNLLYPGTIEVVATKAAPVGFEYIYFSFITLATVGYGDIVSHSIYSKPYIVLESITGVFYVAILVARLVNAFSRQSKI